MYLVPGYLHSRQLLNSYEKITQLLYEKKIHKVAFVMGHFPEYPLMAMLRETREEYKIEWSHIRYYSLINENDNFNKKFFYEAIVTNDTMFTGKIKSPIVSIHRFPQLWLVILEKSDSTCYRLESIVETVNNSY